MAKKKRDKREVGVMFVDIARFLDATRTWGDEDVAEFLQDFYMDMGDVLTEHGGRIIKYMGDALMAVFEPDHVDDAVRCAEALHESFGTFTRDRNLNLGLSIGLHLDEVILGGFGHSSCEIHDVLGKGVMLAGLICGEGTRISDRAYDRLTTKMDTTRSEMEASWLPGPVTVHTIPMAAQAGTKPVRRF
ncbi:MAG: adenylate/guanylate cyclase domain-containing protein [Planctomycetes bacterium]|nr:adenylate/guanylate cyclase domain-containing protein [Planctomycetota bacterium]